MKTNLGFARSEQSRLLAGNGLNQKYKESQGVILNTVSDWNWYGKFKRCQQSRILQVFILSPKLEYHAVESLYYQLQPWLVVKICIEVKTNVWELSQMQAAQAFAGNNDLGASRWNLKHMVSSQNWYHKSEPLKMSREAVKCSSRILQKSSETSYLKCQQAGYCNIVLISLPSST